MIEGFVTIEISVGGKESPAKGKRHLPLAPSPQLNDVSHIVASQYAAIKSIIPEAHMSNGKLCRGHRNIDAKDIRRMLLETGTCKLRIPEREINLVRHFVKRLFTDLLGYQEVAFRSSHDDINN
jgi:hypothetical protein